MWVFLHLIWGKQWSTSQFWGKQWSTSQFKLFDRRILLVGVIRLDVGLVDRKFPVEIIFCRLSLLILQNITMWILSKLKKNWSVTINGQWKIHLNSLIA